MHSLSLHLNSIELTLNSIVAVGGLIILNKKGLTLWDYNLY